MNYTYSTLGYSDFDEETDYFNLDFDVNNYKWGADIIQQGEKERKEREKQRYEEQVNKIKNQVEEANTRKRKREEKHVKEYIEQNGTNLWTISDDYPNVFVPISVKNIRMLDKVNTLSLCLGEKGKYSVMTTLLRAKDDIKPYTMEEYYEQFCKKIEHDGDTKYIYTKDVDLEETIFFSDTNGNKVSKKLSSI